MTRPIFAAIAAALFLAAAPAQAQEAAALPLAASNADAPVDISAAGNLEWNSRDKTYTAHQDVIVKQGAMEVHSDTLAAHYDDGGKTASITQIVAEGNVVISSPPYKGYGDKAVYDTAAQTATLTGNNLRIETPDESLKAADAISFDMGKNLLTAKGQATATRGTDSVASQDMQAFFAKDKDGKTALQKIVADHPVTIQTARETVTGSKGVYDVAGGKATLTGDVRIKQGDSWLAGTRAEVDLNTGISRLFADAPVSPAATGAAAPAQDGSGRVRGVFYPKKKQAATP
jgi:lipopolysaccharide export system protein LptA